MFAYTCILFKVFNSTTSKLVLPINWQGTSTLYMCMSICRSVFLVGLSICSRGCILTWIPFYVPVSRFILALFIISLLSVDNIPPYKCSINVCINTYMSMCVCVCMYACVCVCKCSKILWKFIIFSCIIYSDFYFNYFFIFFFFHLLLLDSCFCFSLFFVYFFIGVVFILRQILSITWYYFVLLLFLFFNFWRSSY